MYQPHLKDYDKGSQLCSEPQTGTQNRAAYQHCSKPQTGTQNTAAYQHCSKPQTGTQNKAAYQQSWYSPGQCLQHHGQQWRLLFPLQHVEKCGEHRLHNLGVLEQAGGWGEGKSKDCTKPRQLHSKMDGEVNK